MRPLGARPRHPRLAPEARLHRRPVSIDRSTCGSRQPSPLTSDAAKEKLASGARNVEIAPMPLAARSLTPRHYSRSARLKRRSSSGRAVHMNGRVEDAVTGRMLSADALIPDGANPQSYNRYTYGYNNPLTNTDPSGFCTPAWACKQDAGSGLGQCRVCGGSDPGDAGFNNLAMQQFAAISADPDQGFLAGLDDIASSLANPIDQSRGCLIGCPSATVDLTPPTTCAPGPENGGQGICTVTVCAHCQAPIDLSPFPTGIPSVASLTGQQPQTVPQGDQNQQQPCTGLAGAIVDLTGGESNQSFVDDVVNNFVDTNDSIASTATKTGLSLVGGGTAAAAYYGTTPFQAIGLAWSAYNSSVRIPGLIGSATPLQLFSTAAATWAINSVLIKGSYDAGVLAGSILRTGANRLATATCGRGP